jgi:nudix-type nucleoside diphosphatase (YffH/AdpP family)
MSDRVKNINKELLSDNWYHLYRLSFDYKNNAGSWQSYQREAYDRGNGAAILLYNSLKNSVILTRQFRMPTFINGNTDGHLIEACAGLLDNDNPVDCIKKETEEETGFRLNKVTKIFEAYMSPGSVTEILHFFVAEYDEQMRINEGGGLAEEQENIEVLELKFQQALKMISTGEIKDAKTIMLLQYAQIHELLRQTPPISE